MKNLILLLTSLLLAGAANAGFAEFMTDDTSQVEGRQDFQVAHACGGATIIHIPSYGSAHTPGGYGGHGGKDRRGHKEFGKCEHRWKIEVCALANRVINLWSDSSRFTRDTDKVCGKHCEHGLVPGKGADSIKCVPTDASLDCHQKGGTMVNGQCKTCSGNTPVATPDGRGCITMEEYHADKAKVCNARNQVYMAARDRCETCAYWHPHRGANKCFKKRVDALTHYCSTLGKLYNPTNDNCDTLQSRIDWCNGRDEVYILERNRCEKCAEWHPKRVGNTCNACPGDHAWQAAHNNCISYRQLGAFCRGANDKVYSPKTNSCERACSDGQKPDWMYVCR